MLAEVRDTRRGEHSAAERPRRGSVVWVVKYSLPGLDRSVKDRRPTEHCFTVDVRRLIEEPTQRVGYFDRLVMVGVRYHRTSNRVHYRSKPWATDSAMARSIPTALQRTRSRRRC